MDPKNILRMLIWLTVVGAIVLVASRLLGVSLAKAKA